MKSREPSLPPPCVFILLKSVCLMLQHVERVSRSALYAALAQVRAHPAVPVSVQSPTAVCE